MDIRGGEDESISRDSTIGPMMYRRGLIGSEMAAMTAVSEGASTIPRSSAETAVPVKPRASIVEEYLRVRLEKSSEPRASRALRE